MLGLGIESTAHTFSCAVIKKKGKKGKILSDVRKIYRPPDGEGIHPREASRHHIENSSSVLSECLDEAKISKNDLDIHFLCWRSWIRTLFACRCSCCKIIVIFYNIPIYPVNHAIGHIELGKLLTGAKKSISSFSFWRTYNASCISKQTMESFW